MGAHQSAAAPQLHDLIDIARYRLDRPDTAAYRAAVAEARDGLRSDGCAVVRGLLRPTAIRVISDEIVARKHTTHFSTQDMNPYFHVTPNHAYPTRHPMNTFIERSSGFIPGDSWDASCATDALFRSPALARFIADSLEEPELHCYADPLAGLTANILDPGQQFTWHFDTNEFAVTLLVDEADEGGLFEYSPMTRTPTDENFEGVQQILEGGREGVHTLDLRAGDMQIFRGRHSLHRVTRVPLASRPRHAAIFAYTQEANVIGRLERTLQLFGRALPAHEAAERARVRADALID